MNWVKIIYIVQTNWSWKQSSCKSSTVQLSIVLHSSSQISKDLHSAAEQSTITWVFTEHLYRINKPGKFKTNEACSIMQQGVRCAWHHQLPPKKKRGQFFPTPWFIWLYKIEDKGTGTGSCCASKALMVPYGDRIKPEYAWECNISHVVSSLPEH